MEHFEIEQTRVAHDALGDAFNTALVCTHLDMAEGLRLYPDANQILAARMPNAKPKAETQDNDALLHESYPGFTTKAAAFADERITALSCPVCGKALHAEKWVNQGDQRYMNVYTCEEDGPFLVRAKFRKNQDDNTWTANKLVYSADQAAVDFYRTKAAQSRRRGRGHKRKSKSANK